MASKTPFFNFLQIVFTSIFALVLFLIILPVLLIIFSPLFLHRWILARILKGNCGLGKIFSPHNTFYATNTNPDSKTPNWANIILNMKIQGKLNLEAMIDKLVSVGYGLNDKTGELMYPEFHQYCVSIGGHLFWKWEDGDKDTRVGNHISMQKIPEDSSTVDYVMKFSKEFLKSEFKAGQSPWEVIFLENDVEGDRWFILLFKFHHSLADGCSIFNVMMNCVDVPVKMTLPRIQNPNKTVLRNLVNCLVFPFKAAYDFCQVSMEGMGSGSPWTMDPATQMSESRDFMDSKIISIPMLQNAGNAFGVSMSAVVVAALSGGIGRFLKKYGHGNLPDTMMCQMPVPIPNHPEGLTNSFSIVSLCLPVGFQKLEDRLNLAEKTILAAKGSKYSSVAYGLGEIFGCLPQFLLRKMSPAAQALQLSIFPGPRSLMTIDGHPVQNMSYTIHGALFIPVVITLLSYNDGIQITLNVDANLFPSESKQLGNLMAEIEMEFEESCKHVLKVV